MRSPSSNTDSAFAGYEVWDRPTRLFHWINAFLILLLVGLGLAILNSKVLQVGPDGKILLKTLHSWTGYAFIVNLSWRIVHGFIGNRYARWANILPFRKGYIKSLFSYLSSFFGKGAAETWLGHNPAARIIISLMMLSLTTQAVTGIVLAGTDLYWPPFGHEFKEQVMAAGEDHSKIVNVVPGVKENLDPEGYKEMRAFREPFIEVHETNFFILLILITLHIAGVVVTEIRENNALVSAMITGRKYVHDKPLDGPDEEQSREQNVMANEEDSPG